MEFAYIGKVASLATHVMGISAYYHDSACCLLRDGMIVAAAQEERFSRKKHDPSLPVSAWKYCLDEAGLHPGSVDCVAFYENPRRKLSRQIWTHLATESLPSRGLFGLDSRRPIRDVRQALGFEGRVEFVEHHASHAASSYYFSGFTEAAILTADAVGEWTTTSYGRGSGGDLSFFDEVEFPHSLGALYSAVTQYLGFDVNDAEYKVMGLAPYGTPRFRSEMMQLIQSTEGGQFRLNMDFFDFVDGESMFSSRFCDLFGEGPREPGSPVTSFAEDVARSLQVTFEELLLEKVQYLYRETRSANLCMAGGVALNSVANGRVRREGPFQDIFIQPAAGDAGGAIGAAAIGYRRIGGELRTSRMTNALVGPRFTNADIAILLEDAVPEAEDYRTNQDRLIEGVAGRLVDGQIVGWFQGGMEFGPRALGSRSILADPRDPEMRDRINAVVKKREGFRPFAPAVLEHHAHTHFESGVAAPFMLETCQVASPLDLPAVTHVDGSARPQTVDRRTNPRFFMLLEEFYRVTGCPMLLNTSFNMAGEPIVCSPVDAVLCFIRSQLDALVIEDFVVDREALPAEWIRWFGRMSPAKPPAVSSTMYTFV